MSKVIKDEDGKPLKGSCGDEIAYKLAKRDIVLHFRENPTISNKELLVWAQSKGHDSSDIADIIRHLNYARVFKKSELVKSNMEGNMKKSGLALVIFPGELTKAAKLSGVGAKHPMGLSNVGGKTKSKIPYTSHTERMALAKMAAERMMAPKPENEGKYADTPEVDRKGREKGQKPPGSVGSTGVSGEGSQVHDNFGRETVIVNPTDLGAGRPESAAKYGGVKKVPRKS